MKHQKFTFITTDHPTNFIEVTDYVIDHVQPHIPELFEGVVFDSHYNGKTRSVHLSTDDIATSLAYSEMWVKSDADWYCRLIITGVRIYPKSIANANKLGLLNNMVATNARYAKTPGRQEWVYIRQHNRHSDRWFAVHTGYEPKRYFELCNEVLRGRQDTV